MTVADGPALIKPVTERQAAYPRADTTPPAQSTPLQRSPLLWLIVIGLIVFGVCFAIGFFAGNTIFPH
jgi:uncharacterized membrane protein YphA (DoxX/SURF4 family)